MSTITAQFNAGSLGRRRAQQDFLQFHKYARLSFPDFQVVDRVTATDLETGETQLGLSFHTTADEKKVRGTLADLRSSLDDLATLQDVTTEEGTQIWESTQLSR